MKRINEYMFKWPCHICGNKIPIRKHYQHFKRIHRDIDTKNTCYLCLDEFRPRTALLEHRKLCINRISTTRALQRGTLILVGSNIPIKRPKHRVTDNCHHLTNDPLSMFDNKLTPIPDEEPFAPPQQIELKNFDENFIWNEIHSQSFIQWLVYNQSNIHDQKVRQIAKYLSLKDEKWYHIIISRYHMEKFTELAMPVVQATPYKCMCDAGTNDDTDLRVVHAHLLVKIPDIKEFLRVCWKRLRALDGQKFKKLIRIRSRYHLYNSILYTSQTVKCDTKPGYKHHNLGVSLTDGHANLVLLLFRDLFYNHVLESQRQRISFARYNFYTLKENVFASPAENVIQNTGFATKIIVSGFALVLAPVWSPETLTTTTSGNEYLEPGNVVTMESKNHYLNLEPQPGNIVTLLDVLKAADEIQSRWIVWKYQKARQIKNMLYMEAQPRRRLALHCDEESFGIFGDYWQGSFRMPDEEEHVKSFLEKASYTKMTAVVINDEQKQIMKTQYGINAKIQHITTPVIMNDNTILSSAHLTALLLYRSGRELLL